MIRALAVESTLVVHGGAQSLKAWFVLHMPIESNKKDLESAACLLGKATVRNLMQYEGLIVVPLPWVL